MDRNKEDNLITYLKLSKSSNNIDYFCEKTPAGIELDIYNADDLSIVLNCLGLIGAYFNFGKTEEPDDIHDFMYEITITDYGLDIGKYLKMAKDNGFDFSKYLK